MRRLGPLLSAAGLVLLGLIAASGVALALAGLLASSEPGSRLVGRWLAGTLDGLVAGHFKLGALRVTPSGEVELREVEIDDPAGHPVIRVALARVRIDLGGLARRTVAAELELTRPVIRLEPGAAGRLTIVDAFTSAGSTARAPPVAGRADPWYGWTIKVVRLELREGALIWRGAGERSWLRADGLALQGAGTFGAAGVSAAVTLAGQVAAPLEGPLTIDLAARIEGSRLTVPRLVLGAAGSRLEAFGEWDWDRETFRAAASRLALAERDLARLAGRSVAGGALEGWLYAESDGAGLTAAAGLTGPGGSSGGGRVALALRRGRPAPRLVGFDVALTELDPARLLSRAPHGRLSVEARGALAWPIPSPGPSSRGHVTVDRLDVHLPGLELSGAGSWRDAGPMVGGLRLEASDLAVAGPAVAALLGITLPALSGRAAADLSLAGATDVPEVTLTVRSPHGSVGEVAIHDGQAEARLVGAELELEAAARPDPLDGAAVNLRIAARLSPGWKGARLARFQLEAAGQGWTLAGPAEVTFDGPRVDRAELRSGAQRLVISGGSAAGGGVEVGVEATELDLAHLPRALAPASLGLAGRVTAMLRLAGPAGRRALDGHVEVAGGAVGSFHGLSVKGELAWQGETGRARLEGSLRDGETGTIDLAVEGPWPVEGAAPALPVSGRLAFAGWRLQPLLRALHQRQPADGLVGGELTLAGSAGAPRLQARLALVDGRWAELAPLELAVALEAPGATLQAEAELKLATRTVVRGRAELPYDRGALLARPGRTLGRLPEAAWVARFELPGTELAELAGKAGVPAGLSGRLGGEVALTGTPSAPRGQGSLALGAVALAGSPALDGPISVSLEPIRTALDARLESGGAPALQLHLAVAAPVERLGEAEVHRLAPLEVRAAIPGLELPGLAGGRWSPSGRVAVTLEAAGTLAAPRATLALDAVGVKLGEQPLGDLKGTVRTTEQATQVDLTLVPAGGGTLYLEGTLDAVPGSRTTAEALASAPLRLALTGRDLGAGFLPALLPGQIRAASGTMQAELSLAGSPRAPRLAGTLALAGGKVTLPGWGSFTDIGFRATLDRSAVRLQELQVRRGAGRVAGELAVEGLDGAEARLAGSLEVSEFSLARAGMDVATIDARAGLGGRYRDGRLEAEVNIEKRGTVRLPRKAPRNLQPIEDRPDIVIGEPPSERAGEAATGSGPGEGTRPGPVVTIRVRGEELLVKSDQPRVNVEFRTDSTWEVTASPIRVAGTLEAYQGSFEPLAGRIFKVVRGRVTFADAPIGDAQLDLSADYDNPSAKVHATVGGTLRSPKLRLTSEPVLDEATLAMLIVTGRTDVVAGGTQGSALTAQDAGMAAAMAVANKAFEERLGEKMPIDSLTLDSSAVSAGKQLTDRIRVSYVRRFDARPEKGENVEEVQVQYQITPHWRLETRYGNAGAGGASVMWQKDY